MPYIIFHNCTSRPVRHVLAGLVLSGLLAAQLAALGDWVPRLALALARLQPVGQADGPRALALVAHELLVADSLGRERERTRSSIFYYKVKLLTNLMTTLLLESKKSLQHGWIILPHRLTLFGLLVDGGQLGDRPSQKDMSRQPLSSRHLSPFFRWQSCVQHGPCGGCFR